MGEQGRRAAVAPASTNPALPVEMSLAILLEIDPEPAVETPQKRAIQTYRARLNARGLARFEVLGRDADRDLIRSLARRLAEDGPEISQLRASIRQTMAGGEPGKGNILAALRRSPLVGAELRLTRDRDQGRDIRV